VGKGKVINDSAALAVSLIPAPESIGCPNRVLQNRPPTFIYEGVDIDAQPGGMKAEKHLGRWESLDPV
jgi:hypothetical protein